MLKNLSRIFGITGSALALSVFMFNVVNNILIAENDALFGLHRPYSFFVTDAIPILAVAAGLVGVFSISKKPVLAAILLIVSGQFVYPFYPRLLYTFPVLMTVLFILIPTLLTAAGVLTLIGAYKASGSNEQPLLKKFSHTTGITGAALITLLCVILTVQRMYTLSTLGNIVPRTMLWPYLYSLVASAAGLLGSLLVRKRNVFGAVLMLLSGAYIFFASGYWLDLRLTIPALLLTASGTLALVGAYKTSVSEALPVLKKLSIITGITGGVTAFLESNLFILVYLFVFPSYGFIIGILIYLISVSALAAGCNIRKHPVIFGAAMIMSGALIFTLNYVFLPDTLLLVIIPTLLLIAAGALAIISRFTRNSKASDVSESHNEDPDEAG